MKELYLAKQTRNCFIHSSGEVDPLWLKAYEATKRPKKYEIGEPVPLDFHDIEDWSDLMVKIVTKSIEIFN